ncbi:MAG: hypothetical protein HON90_04145 [Halobacteriovoraceae bacterium]|jgi:hypothetical protein|nr:hypothetical protein [Halobacteriovoraceae bacterium]
MEKNYYQIAQQFNRNDNSSYYRALFDDVEKQQDEFNSEKFVQVFYMLKERYAAIFELLGEENFKKVSNHYFRYNPIQSSKFESYGKSFCDFLEYFEPLSEFRYLKWLAKLDWFWFAEKDSMQKMSFPKGTLVSWGNICKHSSKIDIQLDESIIEVLRIIKTNNEYKIVES